MRRSLSALLALLVVGPLVLVMPVARAADDAQLGGPSGDDIVITVPLQVFGADQATLDRWENAIESTFSSNSDRYKGAADQATGARFCGGDWRVDVVVTSTDGGFDLDSQAVFAMHPRPGQYFIDHVSFEDGLADYLPYVDTATGRWDVGSPDAVIVHEFAHMLGLDDEYVENDTNGNGVRDPGERTSADPMIPDSERSMMAKLNGGLLDRHIEGLMRNHGTLCRALDVNASVMTTANASLGVTTCWVDRTRFSGVIDVLELIPSGIISGSGSMSVEEWAPVTRCDTCAGCFGGLRHLFLDIKLFGARDVSVVDSDYEAFFTADDQVEFFFASGEVYRQSGAMRFYLDDAVGFNVSGTLDSFRLPPTTISSGTAMRFEFSQNPGKQLGWSGPIIFTWRE